MNKNILNIGVQNYINKNISTDIMSVLLKKPLFEGVTPQELAQQVESKKKCEKKLPTWFNTPLIYYPKKINIEQTSSEIAAAYKSTIVSGKTLLDLTGGYGVDSYFFSQIINHVVHCEIDKNLAQIALHNFQILGAKNIQNFAQDGIDFLRNSKQRFEWIFIDPSRRNENKGKVFKLADCLPNIPENLDLLFSRSDHILIKTSPLLDISLGIQELRFVKEIHIIAIDNDVKEVLWVLERGFANEIAIKTINFAKSTKQIFEFTLSEEKKTNPVYGAAGTYLYVPNAAILKAGSFKAIGNKFLLKKLHRHTHLYTSEQLVDFPGRRFQIEKVLPFNKKNMKELKVEKANIATRNFPENVASIRKKHKIKEGGTSFLFFLKNFEDKHICIICAKT
ncbi:THUMP-like domain-containing protein [Maribacter sp. 2308TA10-17]|uniref:THUMP-like domain-containing protein n=1 Tax=Maribacter sp. 2308TA10-17 TaxID=3386276 RepID=UPI0039BCCD39